MPANSGQDGALLIGANTVAHITDWEMSAALDALETTAFGDSYERTFIPGLRNITATFSGYYGDTDAAQTALLTEVLSTDQTRASVTAILLTESATGSKDGFTGSAVVTGVTVGAAQDGVQTFSGTLQYSGGVSKYST